MTEKSLQEELAEVRAKRAALEASKNARDAEVEMRATLEREKRALADAEAIEKAEPWAVALVLKGSKTGKERGYGDRMDVTSNDEKITYESAIYDRIMAKIEKRMAGDDADRTENASTKPE